MNFLFLPAAIFFAFVDSLLWKRVGDTPWRFPYRIFQFCLQVTITYFLYQISWHSAGSFLLFWWFGGCDVLYYWMLSFPVSIDEEYGYYWLWWTPVGIFKHVNNQTFTAVEVLVQALVGFVCAITLSSF